MRFFSGYTFLKGLLQPSAHWEALTAFSSICFAITMRSFSPISSNHVYKPLRHLHLETKQDYLFVFKKPVVC